MQGFHNKMVYKYHINDAVIIVLTYCHNCKHFIIIFEFSLTTQTVECVKFHDATTEASIIYSTRGFLSLRKLSLIPLLWLKYRQNYHTHR